MNIKAITAALVATAGLLVVAPSAHAEDVRPCVSKVEARVHHHGDNRRDVEKAWDVQGLGGIGIMATLLVPAYNTYIVDYPSCGYNDREGGVAVFYREDDNTVRFVMRYWSDTATLHGHARFSYSRTDG